MRVKLTEARFTVKKEVFSSIKMHRVIRRRLINKINVIEYYYKYEIKVNSFYAKVAMVLVTQ